MNIREFLDVRLLEEVMEEWSKATGMATIAMDSNNEYLSSEIGFTDFCIKHTRGSKEGLRRCTMSDACNTGVYYCHAGLMDFSTEIRLEDGTYLGKIIGGQILPKKPDLDSFRKLASEIGVDQDVYIDALAKIEIRSEDAIRASAALLGRVVNYLVNSEYANKKQEIIIKQMEMESKFDPLTGAYNKSFMRVAVESKIDARKKFMLMIADLDDFKGINDNYGHLAGDAVLKNFSDAAINLFRSTDIVGRFGGDEFYFIIESKSPSIKEAMDLGGRICEAAGKMAHDGIDRSIAASVGIALYPNHGTDCESLFRKADKALYKAKNNGKAQCCVYEE